MKDKLFIYARSTVTRIFSSKPKLENKIKLQTYKRLSPKVWESNVENKFVFTHVRFVVTTILFYHTFGIDIGIDFQIVSYKLHLSTWELYLYLFLPFKNSFTVNS